MPQHPPVVDPGTSVLCLISSNGFRTRACRNSFTSTSSTHIFRKYSSPFPLLIETQTCSWYRCLIDNRFIFRIYKPINGVNAPHSTSCVWNLVISLTCFMAMQICGSLCLISVEIRNKLIISACQGPSSLWKRQYDYCYHQQPLNQPFAYIQYIYRYRFECEKSLLHCSYYQLVGWHVTCVVCHTIKVDPTIVTLCAQKQKTPIVQHVLFWVKL